MTETKKRETGSDSEDRPKRHEREREKRQGRDIISEARTLIASSPYSPDFWNPSRSLILLVDWDHVLFTLPPSRFRLLVPLVSIRVRIHVRIRLQRTCVCEISHLDSHLGKSHCPVPRHQFHLRVPAVFLGCSSSHATVRQYHVFVGGAEMRRGLRRIGTLDSFDINFWISSDPTSGRASSRGTFREVNGIFDLWRGLQMCGRGELRELKKRGSSLED